MDYFVLAKIYDELESTTKRLEKTYILSEFFKKVPIDLLSEICYLVQGRVFAQWGEKKIGMSSKLIVKALMKSTGNNHDKVMQLWKKLGDLGEVGEELAKKTKQRTLFSSKLTIKKVIDNFRKLPEIEGGGSVDKKIALVSELLTSAQPLEVKYIVRTVLEDLRTGVAQGVLRDALVWAYLPKIIGVFVVCKTCKKIVPETKKCLNCKEELVVNEEIKLNNVLEIKDIKELEKKDLNKIEYILAEKKLAREIYNGFLEKVSRGFDLTTDFGLIAQILKKDGLKGLNKLKLMPGKPIKVMLYLKAKNIKDALDNVGSPAIIEPKFDGFRLQIHKLNDKVFLFTRRLENVTNQFPDVVEYVKKYVKSDDFILDAEVVGLDKNNGKILPFQNMSKRIKRKHDIKKLIKEIPVKVVVFDIMEANGDSLLNVSLEERRKKIKAIVKHKKNVFEIVDQLVSGNEEKINKFYQKALAEGHEGVMMKNVNGLYKPGSRVGFGMKIKPIMEPLDLVIVAAEWGEGKRSKWFASFTLACKKGDKFLEIGKVGTGFKEKGDEGVSFENMTKKLKPLVIEEKGRFVKVKPRVILEVNYEEIQKSISYSSGYALRFPRVIRERTDEKDVTEINSLKEVEEFYNQQL